MSCHLNFEEAPDLMQLTIERCSFNYANMFFVSKTPIRIRVGENINIDSSDFKFVCTNVLYTKVYGNHFEKKNVELRLGETVSLQIHDNGFNNLILSETKVNTEFILERNQLSGKLLMGKFYFAADPENSIDWIDLKNYRLAMRTDNNITVSVTPDQGLIQGDRIEGFGFNSGENPKDISTVQDFNKIIGLYSMFLNLYKNENNLESYNACFITIKELQSKRLKYQYESQSTFETYFSWKLSQLLKFYVRYGTNPARAIVISLYIIFWFGAFFFFFPSDWDTTSKKKLIQNFKDFIQKNEKGYVVPFFVLLAGFALSLVNALTLSLNAFITLGFGNIPTHGLARYVCVIEGFMGWFLLSIFTVALINQVL
jgi:hypothetical protein